MRAFYAQKPARKARNREIIMAMKRRAASRTQAEACATLILLACCPCASALNPSLDINQYAHTAWMIGDGLFKSAISSITQTPDGYLWIGTESGLLRFDGVRTVPWQPPAGDHLPGGSVRSLLATRDGRLWIGTTEGLASWKDGKLMQYPEIAGPVRPLLEDREGMVWAGGFASNTGRLCAIQISGAHCYGEDGSFGREVISLYEDSHGYLWAGAATGLWRWKPGPPKLYPMPDLAGALTEGDDDGLLIVMRQGIRRLVNEKAEAYPLPDIGQPIRPIRSLRDRNGGLWVGTAGQGLLHFQHGRADLFARSDGLSGDFISNLFEDREGNIWITTSGGLDRFRDFAISTISVKQGLSSASVSSVLAARDGSVWLGTNNNGLNRLKNGQITIYRKRSDGLPDDDVEFLFQDDRGRIWVSTPRGTSWFENGRFIAVSGVPGGQVHSIAGDGAGNLWISHEDQGLLHLLGASLTERITWSALGRKDYALDLLADPAQRGLWLAFSRGGVAFFKDGQVRASYTADQGLGKGRANRLQLDTDGTLWAATEGGLSRIRNGRVTTLASANGLPCDTVRWMRDDEDSFWLYTACGLVRIARPELDGWVKDPKRTIQVTVFDSSDGVRVRLPVYSGRVAESSDGKIWFLPLEGVSVIDPRHLPFNKLPPPVHIEQITADRKAYWQNSPGDASSNLRLPPLVRDLEIDYTALSLVAPEKIRFRVKLEGRDPDWNDVGNARKAFYNDLPPRNYRFRVMASNNSGVWNESGASFDFSIAPAYYQTRWFQASCVAALLGLLWALYRFRLHQIAQEFNMRLEERVGERTRIARELHDTLLQSFHGLLFRFQAARNMLPKRPEEAIQVLDIAIARAEDAIAEGRGAIQGLRPEPAAAGSLAHLVTVTGRDLAGAEDAKGHSPAFRVTEEGERQTLSPILQDEVYRIARELLRNAFRHADAHQIEVEIRYDSAGLRVRIRDDGKGIDPKVLQAGGRADHWGLPGIRERAKQIGARLDLWSDAGAGTEVELTVPATVAYAKARKTG
jgi:ligand-binding sensor domain-containing protein/signal transduction histidine kinase